MRKRLEERDFWLVDSLAVPASLHDVDGYFVHVNHAAELASGRTNEQMRGTHFRDALPPEARPNVEAEFRRAAELGEPADFETPFVDAAGHRRGARAQHLPLRDGDEIIGVLILAFEVRRVPSAPIPVRPELTPRQREILELVAAGLSTGKIAAELTLSTETVRNHLRSLFKELGAHTRVEAIANAQRLGLLANPGLSPQRDD